MKKLTRPIAASVLALAVVIALAACGSSNSSSIRDLVIGGGFVVEDDLVVHD